MRKHVIIAGVILGFEACVGIGLVGAGYGMVLTVTYLILAITEKQHKWERVAVIYALMVVSTMALLSRNMRLAQRRAAPVIAGINRYYSDKGAYPKTLGELVPAYLPSIPHAGFTALSRNFRYFDDRPQLYFAAMFHGVVAYDFPTQTWRTNE